jgi:hypothetical protein
MRVFVVYRLVVVVHLPRPLAVRYCPDPLRLGSLGSLRIRCQYKTLVRYHGFEISEYLGPDVTASVVKSSATKWPLYVQTYELGITQFNKYTRVGTASLFRIQNPSSR